MYTQHVCLFFLQVAEIQNHIYILAWQKPPNVRITSTVAGTFWVSQ